MTQADKELLLKDLCARLPYGAKVEYNNYTCEVLSIDRFHEELTIWKCAGTYPDANLEDCKPYLRPMSSMTGDEMCEYISLKEAIHGYNGTEFFETYESIDWLNKNMFDYHNLIPMGLANDATGKNIY